MLGTPELFQRLFGLPLSVGRFRMVARHCFVHPPNDASNSPTPASAAFREISRFAPRASGRQAVAGTGIFGTPPGRRGAAEYAAVPAWRPRTHVKRRNLFIVDGHAFAVDKRSGAGIFHLLYSVGRPIYKKKINFWIES